MDSLELLDALTHYEALPEAAIREATERRTEMLPLFVKAIETFLADPHLAAPGGDGVFMMTHMLGSWREKSAYRLLVRLLRDDPDRLDAVFGDALTESIPGIVLNVFDGDPGPLYALIESQRVDEILRSDMIQVLASLVERGDLPREDFVAWLRQASNNLRPRGESHVWVGWQGAVALLGLDELADSVRKIFARGWIDRTILDWDDFAADLLEASRDRMHWRLEQIRAHPFGDTIETLSTWYGFSEEYLAKRRSGEYLDEQEDDAFDSGDALADAILDDRDPTDDYVSHDPITNPFRHVGRNDPCPCGSGKKFKRCCLDKAA